MSDLPDGPPEDLPDDLTAALEAFAARGAVLVALDFDGVVAPIVDEPGAARPLDASAAAVEALAGRDGVHVALVSGRALEDLRAVAAPPPGAVLVASHGAEVDGAPSPPVPEQALRAVTDALEAVAAGHPGTAVERKPSAAVLHTRRADREVAAAATEAALRAVEDVDGARVIRGKEVVEVAVVAADKGSAVRDLRARLGVDAVLYVGDDVTDEDAFAALEGDGDVGVKVGDGGTRAAYRVDGPEQVTALLDRLVALRP
jgi:trehalose 6-phosphate phosphatase